MKRKLFLLPALMLMISRLVAQPVTEDLPQITGCIALVNARVTTAPGKPVQVSTIIIRNGLITDIGAHPTIPADAYQIQADSMYAYPAFIDAFSAIGIKSPEADANRGGPPGGGPGNRDRNARPTIDEEGNASLEDAGITPFHDIRSTFDVNEKSISDWRGLGFAIAHVMPKGKMIPGKGSLMVLAGTDEDELYWKENVSMFGQWVGAGDSYPGTVIGVMAKWRELYHNATQDLAQQTSYSTASLVPRPHYNQAHEALIPLVKKEIPLYFRAPKVKDISRALAMQKDLGMKMVICDAEEAWYLRDQFKTNNIPIILSLHLPEDKSDDKKTDDDKKPKDEKNDSTATMKDSVKTDITKKAEKNPETIAFEKKRAESLKAHFQQAGMLAKEGIPFSFGTWSGKTSEFSKSIKTMMDNGLTADQALSALTTQPAKLLGIDKYCGTLETGKMANVILSNKPIFEKEAAIRFMIVEGSLYAYEVKEKKNKPGKDAHAVTNANTLSGTWSYTINVPDDKKEGTFVFNEKDGSFTGTISSSDITSGNNELESIVLDGNSVSFTFDFEIEGNLLSLEFNLTLHEDSFDGSVSIENFGTFDVSGQRISKPKNETSSRS